MAVITVIAVIAGTAALSGCGPRTLVVVDSCADGSTPSCLVVGDSAAPADIEADAGAAPDASSTLQQGLVAHWRFDESAGSVVAVDSSGNGNDGMLIGLGSSSAWVIGGGRLGNALAVDGQGYVWVPPSRSIDGIVGGVTMSAWVYPQGNAFDYSTAVSRQIGATVFQYYHLALREPADTPSLFIATSITTTANATTSHPIAAEPVPQQRWTHLAATYDGSVAVLYVNGAPVLSAANATGNFSYALSDGSPDMTPVILGGNGNLQPVTELFPGLIDEIALYDRALTGDEIRLLAGAAIF